MVEIFGTGAAAATIGSFILQGVKEIKRRNAPNSPESPVQLPPINPPEDRNIIGREDDLKRLQTKLTMAKGAVITSKGTVLQADGGYGKTTLASAYATGTRDRYQGGLWINAETRDGTAQMFSDIVGFGAAAFGFPVPDPITEGHVKAVINGISHSGAPLLLVYDNVDDLSALRPFLPTGDHIHILITTRDTGPVAGFSTLDLDVLAHDGPDSPAVKLLLQEAGTPLATDRADAAALADTLGGLPLALVLAGALARRGETFADISRDIDTLLDHQPAKGEQYRDSLSVALALSYDKLSTEAKLVADIVAWWAADGLTPNLFTDAPGVPIWHAAKADVPEALQTALSTPSTLRAAFADLRELSLLRAEGPSQPHRMHRLTATILRHRQGDRAEANARSAAALLAAVYPADQPSPLNPVAWPLCRTLTPHGQALWQAASPLWHSAWDKPAWRAMDALLNQIALFLDAQEDRAGALSASKSSLDLKTAAFSEADRGLPVAIGNHALQLMQSGQLAQAQGPLDHALDLDAKHRPDSANHATRLRQRAALEFCRHEAGDTSDQPADLPLALTHLKRALGIEKDLAKGTPTEDLARTWNDIGYLHRLAGRAAEMAEVAYTAYDTLRAVSDPNESDLATYAMNAGVALLEAGHPAKAEATLRQAHEIIERIYAETPEHSRRRIVAGWLSTCLLVLDRAEGTTARAAQAQEMAEAVGLSFAKMKADAAAIPLSPPET